jgi:hypothetical protein
MHIDRQRYQEPAITRNACGETHVGQKPAKGSRLSQLVPDKENL